MSPLKSTNLNPLPNTIHKEQVVYEDNHIIIINKLPSEIVQGDKTGDMPLSEKLKNFIKERDSKPGNVFMGVIHRIDRPVSGLIIFAKTSKALSRFNELIRVKGLNKTYWAVVKNKPPKTEDHLIHYLLKNEKANKSKAFEKEVKDSLKSELIYKFLKSSDTYHLLEIKLLTGRHHQIRCQLSTIGSPIKGDLKYGFDRSNKDASIHLHAYSLSFMHPIKLEEVKVKAAPLMNDPVWNYFK